MTTKYAGSRVECHDTYQPANPHPPFHSEKSCADAPGPPDTAAGKSQEYFFAQET